MAKVLVDIGPDGKTTLKVVGTHGPACTNLTKALEEALGKVERRTFTSDFYAKSTDTPIKQKEKEVQ